MQAVILAEFLIDRQPESIRRRLMIRDGFGAKVGLAVRTVVTISGAGRFGQDELLGAARDALGGESGEQRLLSLDGTEASVTRGGDGLILEHRGADGPLVRARLDDLVILSPNRDERSAALDDLLRRIGPAAPDFTGLRRAIAARDLSDKEADVALREAWSGVATRQRRAITALEAGRATLDDMVPDTLGYYDKFCGPDPGDAEPEVYLGSVLPAYRRTLLRRDLAKGMELCLLGGLRDDLSPANWLQEVSDDVLWAALDQAAPRRDPYSLLGALDVALARPHDPRFQSLAEEAVEALARDDFPLSDQVDAYEFVPVLASLVFDRITTLEGGALRPPFWRRMCAWMQAGLLARSSLQLDLPGLRRWAAEDNTAAGAFAKALDLRREPMFRAAAMSAGALRAESVGRLLLLRSRHEAAGRPVPNAAAVDAAVKRLTERSSSYGIFAPGPLEGHRRPAGPLPGEAASALTAALSDQPAGSVWAKLSNVSQLFALDGHLMDHARRALQGVVLDAARAEREHRLLEIEDACLLAAAQRDTGLAREIGATLVRHASTIDADGEVGAVLMGLLLAGAAFEDEHAWMVWLAGQLLEVAARLPAGETIQQFAIHLQELKRVLPPHLPVHARAAALCAATA